MHRTRRAALVASAVAGLLVAVVPGTRAQVTLPARSEPNSRVGTDPSAFRGRDTPGLAANPTNPDHLVEVEVDVGQGRCEWNTSFDGGRTFPINGVFTTPGYPPPAPPAGGGAWEPPCDVSNQSASMDGSVAFGSGQNVYVPYATRRTAAEGWSVAVARSTDGGRTFLPGVVAMAPAVGAATPTFTRPELAVERRVGLPDRIYVASGNGAFSGGPVQFAFSEDGGLTFTEPAGFPRPQPPPPAAPVPPVRGDISGENTPDSPSNPVVAPDGTVYVAYRTVSGPCPAPEDTIRTCGQIKVSKSTDGGRTWAKTNGPNVRGYGPDISGATFGGDTVPRLAVDPRPAPVGGALYMTYMQGPTGIREGNPPRAASLGAKGPSASGVKAQDHFIHPNVDVLFVKSTDRAATFTKPVRVNDDPVGTNAPGEGPAQRHPRPSVAPISGRVDVVWQDRRHAYRAPTNSHYGNREARFGDTYYSSSTDGGASFSPNRRVSDETQNLDIGMDFRAGVYWWFAPALVSLENAVLFAWQDSREGNRENDNEDVYLTRLRLGATGPIPVQRVPEGDNPALSVSLSRLAYTGGPEAVLQSTFSNADITRPVIVNQTDAAGALAGGVLSRAYLGPLLLSGPSRLPDDVKADVARVAGAIQEVPQGAFVIGNEGSLSSGVVDDLVATGIPRDKVVRLGGATPADMAAAVAKVVPNRGTEAVIVNPATPEAASASALAAFFRLPVLFVDRDSVPAVTAETLGALGITETLVIGGEGAVSAGVEAQLAAQGRGPTRLGGPDVQSTSEEVATEGAFRRAHPNMATNIIFVAAQERPMDAAVLGASVARMGGTMLMVPDAELAAAQANDSDVDVDRLVVVRATGARIDTGGPAGGGASDVAGAGAQGTAGSQGNGSAGPAPASQPARGPLPLTGMSLLRLLLLALALLGAGLAATWATRRRNGQAAHAP